MINTMNNGKNKSFLADELKSKDRNKISTTLEKTFNAVSFNNIDEIRMNNYIESLEVVKSTDTLMKKEISLNESFMIEEYEAELLEKITGNENLTIKNTYYGNFSNDQSLSNLINDSGSYLYINDEKNELDENIAIYEQENMQFTNKSRNTLHIEAI